MSLNSLDAASKDLVLQSRTIACVVREAWNNPTASSSDYGKLVRKNSAEGISMVWPVVIAAEAQYESALAASNPNPGGDESVISDGMILSAVQASWPANATP